MVEYLALDPGESTGYAMFKSDGDVEDFGTLKGRPALYEFLEHIVPSTVKVVVIEDYTLYPWKGKEQSWSKLDTVRYIGAIEFWAHKRLTQVVFQPPNIKSIAYMWAGIKVPKNHDHSHQTDAYVHGVYYLQKQGIRKPQQARRDNEA